MNKYRVKKINGYLCNYKIIIFIFLFFFNCVVFAESKDLDSLTDLKSNYSNRYIYKVGVEFRPSYVFSSSSFFKGENQKQQPINRSLSYHLKYSFQKPPGSMEYRIYSGVYQGIGLSHYEFGNREELGSPTAVYLFQGARIADLSHRLSLNYEWNFGLSFGWKPYDEIENSYNLVVGSKENAYLNINLYLSQMLSEKVDLTYGVDISHFSNGNTKFPNKGVNTVGLKVGLAYNFNRKTHQSAVFLPPIPKFRPHISYDLLLFGSWRRRGITYDDRCVAIPKKYDAFGISFSPMYNFAYRFRAGVSFDCYHDGSSGIYIDENNYQENYNNDEPVFVSPPFHKQWAAGISGRAEYVMPYFSIGVGLGSNILYGVSDLKGFYQTLSIKMDVTRWSFIHVGYRLKDFHIPSFLMLGFGFRFNSIPNP